VRDTEDRAAAWLGGRLASARGDARRIADELVRRGLLARDEADALEAAVASAAERAAELVAGGLRDVRRAAGDLGDRGPVALDELATRVERLERLVAGQHDGGAGGAGRDERR
jgi:hypothetical protein